MAYELEFLEQLVTRENSSDIQDDYFVNCYNLSEDDYVIFVAPGISQKYTLADHYDNVCRLEIERLTLLMKKTTIEMKREEELKMYVNQMYIFSQGLMIQNNEYYNQLEDEEEEEKLISGNINMHLSVFLSFMARDYQIFLNEKLLKFGSRLNLPDVRWKADSVDLIEMLVALQETESINKPDGKLTRKEAYKFFEAIFNFELKDPDSSLSKAKLRKKDQSPFLESLKNAFVIYCNKDLK